ncbi:MAG: KpsF/GutQ family sugar-phosphate isomerase [Saprospiraceae bacterium]|nr:KpsF/GutQ family sugar-phosphate isomerase [Saprospiraceae bacterium]
MSEINNFVDRARKVFDAEIQCLEAVKEHIDDNFTRAVHLILNNPGRLVVTGIGKSAIVAQKMVATLNSTGSPSIFMHAADAIHGDLGIIQKDDIIIVLSKSGDTPEIKVLTPYLKSMGNKIIGMVSNLNSSLAYDADITLYLPVEREADPNNLAPSSSTTAQMAMGDALAIALLSEKGFSDRDFARYHPGGNLGKQLYTCVRDICRFNNKPLVGPDATIREVIVAISSGRLGVAAVGEEAHIEGIITDGDLRRMLERNTDINNLRARDIMTHSPKTIQGSQLAVNALQMLKNLNITQLLVMDGDIYSGVIHIHDLLKEGFD